MTTMSTKYIVSIVHERFGLGGVPLENDPIATEFNDKEDAFAFYNMAEAMGAHVELHQIPDPPIGRCTKWSCKRIEDGKVSWWAV